MNYSLQNGVNWFQFSLVSALCLLVSCTMNETYQTWEIYKGGPDANNYSSLHQINKSNVKDLEVTWSFYPNDEPEGFQFWKYECNPIVIDNVMYLTSAWRWLYAIDAASGKKIWSFDPLEGERGGGVLRGVTYWSGNGQGRIFVTAGNRLYCVDAKTGTAVNSFGDNGKIILDIPQEGRELPGSVKLSTPGIIFNDLIIIGAAVAESAGAAPGDVRAYNVHTGDLVWTFHTIPQPGEFGYETWPEEAYKYAGGANNWAGMSLDEERGIVYVPTGSPTYDYYAADRHGANLFGNCLIALEAATGKYIWHFQTVHHDIWDYDLPTAPNLITVHRNGEKIDAVAQPTKMGFIYVLDRETGEAVFPVEERPVPASRIPGEQAWPTQPFPLKPESFARQAITENNIFKLSNESLEYNEQIINKLYHRGIFTPPAESETLLIPGSRGGGEWGGGAYDLESGILYINSNESPEIAKIEKVRKSTNADGQTLFEAGQGIYLTYCASCHGADKTGIEANPSLVNIDQRLKKQEMLNIIDNGAGIMPAFASLIDGYEDELLAFLTESGKDELTSGSMAPQDTSSTYLNVTAHNYLLDSLGSPLINPPWGTLNAIDMNTGEFIWKIPLGNDPEYQKPGDPPTGMENYGGPVVTAGGLVFIAATMDSMFRAFDKDTGELLWETELPGNGLATPAVYEVNGRQYVAIAVSIGENLNHNKSGVIAFARRRNHTSGQKSKWGCFFGLGTRD